LDEDKENVILSWYILMGFDFQSAGMIDRYPQTIGYYEEVLEFLDSEPGKRAALIRIIGPSDNIMSVTLAEVITDSDGLPIKRRFVGMEEGLMNLLFQNWYYRFNWLQSHLEAAAKSDNLIYTADVVQQGIKVSLVVDQSTGITILTLEGATE